MADAATIGTAQVEARESQAASTFDAWSARMRRLGGERMDAPGLSDPARRVRLCDELRSEGRPVVQIAVRARSRAGAHGLIAELIERSSGPFAVCAEAADDGEDSSDDLAGLPADHPGVTLGAAGDERDVVRITLAQDARISRGWWELAASAGGVSAPRCVGAAPDWLPPEAASRAAVGVAAIGVVPAAAAPPGGWLETPGALVEQGPLRIAYVVPGVPDGGGGGTHSIMQEALTLHELGDTVQVLVPVEAADHARRTYPEAEAIIGAYADARGLARLLAVADVAVATEWMSVDPVLDATEGRDDVVRAYYIQDYEPLFAVPGTRRADGAMLSYNAAPDLVRFAKTHWVRNAVQIAHDVPVAKVEPSLDRALYRPRPRAAGGPIRVAGMVRPRSPRRRPLSVLHALERAVAELGAEAVAFGCTDDEMTALGSTGAVEHRGLLSRPAVAELLAGCDVLLDLSVYQGFGRTGIEAMACGCVPVLPPAGGVHEYARDGVDAFLVDGADVDRVLAVLAELADDPHRLGAMRAAGLETSGRFSLERAALSQHVLFADALRERP